MNAHGWQSVPTDVKVIESVLNALRGANLRAELKVGWGAESLGDFRYG